MCSTMGEMQSTYSTVENMQYNEEVVVSIEHLQYSEALYYLLTNWLAYLYGRIQSPRPDVMPDRREVITRAAGFVFACIDNASQLVRSLLPD